jgi:hypothetical protein
MADERIAGFMRKYGAQRATDRGPTCPHCGNLVTRETAKTWYAPGTRGPIVHASCDALARAKRLVNNRPSADGTPWGRED